jgi:predicted peptidase
LAVYGFIALRADRTFISNSANPYADRPQDKAEKSIWVVHGDEDTMLPVEVSRRLAAELNSVGVGVGVGVQYTELSGSNQNSRNTAHSDVELIPSLFRQEI